MGGILDFEDLRGSAAGISRGRRAAGAVQGTVTSSRLKPSPKAALAVSVDSQELRRQSRNLMMGSM
eukprot:CAMPEP_0181220322 /NCGR_PEP_ID=MMETSP1096-20121128/28775_1 /TAXON_ID=156174 ORGANISM="Chrysochromulina ericina, Strain CCMP281" /NCGR_SAMPLE_ID=MMETSP1096 /ASSEMBLY_ACC=CAM_ASM_000453 /LENGTH=65 /DNA_ID=CAMNT_0023312817 /DNA_START=348 /DNA_END=545 /DNA_ORIENTATION=-